MKPSSKKSARKRKSHQEYDPSEKDDRPHPYDEDRYLARYFP